MEIAIIGGGFTGLSAGYYLNKKGIKSTIFERDAIPGGLAVGFTNPKWTWPLEMHYHHLFTSDKDILNLAAEVGVSVKFTSPKTSILYHGNINSFDSPISLLKFPHLDMLSKLRVAAITAGLKLTPWISIMDNIPASNFLKFTEGKVAYDTLWKPLFTGKFGDYSNNISLSWYWARIKKRSAKLGYPEGGFQNLAAKIAQNLNIKYNTTITSINRQNNKFLLNINNKEYSFDKLIFTLSFAQLQKFFPDIHIPLINSLGAVNLVLAMNKPLLKNIYWLNINDRQNPFLALVEHTNFIDKKYYGNQHILYIGNYLPTIHRYFNFTSNQLLKEYMPHLKKINSEFSEKNIIDSWVFKAPFAQPVMNTGYHQVISNLQYSIPNFFVANMQLVYPWDRGTNYAVQSGRLTAERI